MQIEEKHRSVGNLVDAKMIRLRNLILNLKPKSIKMILQNLTKELD